MRLFAAEPRPQTNAFLVYSELSEVSAGGCKCRSLPLRANSAPPNPSALFEGLVFSAVEREGREGMRGKGK